MSLVLTQQLPSSLQPYEVELRRSGWICNMIAIVVFVWLIVKLAGNFLRHLDIAPIDISLSDRLYFNVSYCSPSDLDEICALGRQEIGDNHVSEDLLRNRVRRCPHLARKLTSSKKADTKIRGYYILYPLTASGINKIDRHLINSGKGLMDKDISCSFKNARAVYISMIFGDNVFSRAAAIFHMKNDLAHLSEMKQAGRKFYAKPSTKHGLRLLRQDGFRPLDRDTGIWVMES